MVSSVVALLVSHDGGRWLPTVIDGVRAQRAPLAAVLAVDTGSKDDSADLLEQAFDEVVLAPGSTSFPAAVELGLERVRERGQLPEWIWILHDDATPDPGALEALLAAAAADPGADVLGPKLREWPSLRRLLELGVTITGTGRRETGLERGEYDQGQHDEVREVLAVNSAGMLVRRTVLEQLGGFDPQLPIFGNDIDFGWRAAAAGHRTLIVPDAIVFHAEAAHRGVRRTPLTGRHTHYQERRAALYTLLANARARALPWLVVRLAFGTVLRMIGFLLVRSVGEALDDLAALLNLYAHPGEIRAARRARQDRAVAEEHARSLLAPWWLPYRHGLDFLGDLAAAATNQAADVAERRRAAAAEHAPASTVARPRQSEEDELFADDSGLVARFLTNPIALLLTLTVVVALVAARAAFGSLAGGGLSPTPAGVGDWWGLQTETWHPLGTGTAVPAPPYVFPMALLATVLGGSPLAAVSAVFLFAVPLGMWGAWRFLRVVGRLVVVTGAPRWVLLWGSVSWALVPVVCGAWGDGWLGLVAVATVLPWLAHAALGFADPEGVRRWRAAWRVGLLLALGCAFAPVLWVLAAALGLVVVSSAALVVRGAVRDRSVWGPPAAAIGLVPLLLAPWWIPAIQRGAAEGLLLDVGRLPVPTADTLDLLSGRLDGLGAPWWIGVVLAVLAVLALVPRATRIPVLVCWIVALVTAVVAALLGLVSFSLAAATAPAGLGVLVVVLQGCFLVAAVLGAAGFATDLRSWRRAVAGVLGVAAAVVPLGGIVWWFGSDAAVTDGIDTDIPVYMVQSSEEGPEHGILVVRGTVEDGLTYTVRRGDGMTVGEDEIVTLTAEDHDFTDDVQALVSRPSPEVVDQLAAAGIEYVVLPTPADGDVAGVLDSASGLVQASAEERTTRAWQIDRPLDGSQLDGPTSWLRVVLLVVQGVAVVVVLVLCLPTVNRRRSTP
ncbi:glycosyltransferase family 2 protein [Nocardioides mangrovi]|uniref:Glycosyltransferase family 2 protein n=1 Tax=Nocardioides mangrovi TaxID=2874580 RepID=A0ABS7U8P1_9ACTN|nr:glycosyltransferase family 2 protein [Nocardioides mangrovi]MBZ5737336.1 glycosyltransferase family 2 protein [Nocardioides mangrovi]